MTKRWLVPLATLTLLLLLWVSGCAGQQGSSDPATEENTSAETPHEQPYTGLEERRIKALADEEVDDLLAGRGAGYALAAELNHYPGPVHVLELAEALDLTTEQERITSDIYSAMEEKAKLLGGELVDLEEQLDQSFQNEEIDQGALNRITTEIADVEGRLRAVHLGAHLELKEVLRPDQVAAYDRLRGYDGSENGEPGRMDRHGSEGHN
jgi:hypothetical protein